MNLNSIFLTSKLKPREFRTSVFNRWRCLLSLWVHGVLYSGEFLTKTIAAPSQEMVEGGVMIFFEENKVLVVEYIRRNLKNKHDLKIRGKRFTVCTEITIILGTVRFTIRGGRLRYKRYDAHFLKKVVFELPFSSFGDHLINILRKVNRLIYTFKIN